MEEKKIGEIKAELKNTADVDLPKFINTNKLDERAGVVAVVEAMGSSL